MLFYLHAELQKHKLQHLITLNFETVSSNLRLQTLNQTTKFKFLASFTSSVNLKFPSLILKKISKLFLITVTNFEFRLIQFATQNFSHEFNHQAKYYFISTPNSESLISNAKLHKILKP